MLYTCSVDGEGEVHLNVSQVLHGVLIKVDLVLAGLLRQQTGGCNVADKACKKFSR